MYTLNMNNRNCTLVMPPICDQKRGTRTSPGPDLWVNPDRRQLHLSRQSNPEAARGLEEAPRLPSHLDPKPVKLHILGQQHVGKATTDDPPKIVDQSIISSAPDSTGGSKAGKRADIVSLRKHLGRTRLLASAIKRGQSYFHRLQKEEEEEREEEERQRVRREEQLKTEPRPPRFSSDSDSESDGWPPPPAGTSRSGATEARPRRKKSHSARPFTPVHHSLTSPLLSEAPRKVIYRQLCCLSWLLEALTLDRNGRVGPLAACWDPKDPGRGRTTIKALKKERAIKNKWEQFVSTKPQRAPPRRRRSSSARLYIRRESSMSVASLFALTSVTVGSSSVSSLVQVAAEEDTESPDRPPSEGLRTLPNVHQKVETKGQSSQTSSCPAKPPLAISHLIDNKAAALRELKAAFHEKVEEMSQHYVDVLELKARARLNSGLRRYRALCHVTESHGLPCHVTCQSPETKAPNTRNKNDHSNNIWLSTLLSSLPEEVCRERAVSRVLEKLSGFVEQQTLRVRPQVFLKVLGGLELWELCLPELCVAIQIATEHVVQMPKDEYDSWLCSRVTLPPQSHGARKHQVNHTH